MCGRFLLDSDIGDIVSKYRILQNRYVGEYNKGDFCPSQNAPVIFENGERTITSAKWGFSYKDKKGVIINARSETIMNKPMFKSSFYGARCIIPASLFYEWKDEENRKKVKYKIGLQDSSLISLGGIYRISQDTNSKEQLTFVIITTEAEGDIKAIHSRMPLIIKNEDLDLWLNNNTSIELVGKILKTNVGNKFIIERCEETERGKPVNGIRYEQMKMF